MVSRAPVRRRSPSRTDDGSLPLLWILGAPAFLMVLGYLGRALFLKGG